MSNSGKADIRLKFANPNQVIVLMDALTPETNSSATRRANVKLEKEGSFLVLSIKAEDTIALRATLNAYLRWINAAISTIAVLEHV
jgi:KEOPS complex subunit Pcc1